MAEIGPNEQYWKYCSNDLAPTCCLECRITDHLERIAALEAEVARIAAHAAELEARLVSHARISNEVIAALATTTNSLVGVSGYLAGMIDLIRGTKENSMPDYVKGLVNEAYDAIQRLRTAVEAATRAG